MTTTNIWVDMLTPSPATPSAPSSQPCSRVAASRAACAGPLRRRHTRRRPRVEGRGAEQNLAKLRASRKRK